MEDIFQWCKEGNSLLVRLWLDDLSNNMNAGDDHGFSPLHWAAKEGHLHLIQFLLNKGAKINTANKGDDTALHLAVAHGHYECTKYLLKHNPDVNAQNEHGNSPLHYACFWNFDQIAEILIKYDASVTILNKNNESPLDKCRGNLHEKLLFLAQEMDQDLETKTSFTNKKKTRTCDSTLSKYCGIPKEDLYFKEKIASTPSGDTYKGLWQKNTIVAKFLNLGQDPTESAIKRASNSFNCEFPKLRIFSHPNISPVLGCTNDIPNLIVVSEYMENETLYQFLHEKNTFLIDHQLAMKLAIDVARGMAFLHTLNLNILNRYYLNSKHIVIDKDLTAKINMADTKFSFQDKNKFYHPAWMSPEQLTKKPCDINQKASDMWSFAVLLWEIVTRQVPFSEYSPTEIGMKIALEELRLSIPHSISIHLIRLIRICMNEDAGKRPTFEQIIPILEKISRA